MEQQDIRWRQRFQNFDKAFHRLDEAMRILSNDPDNFLLQAGIIQIYEFTKDTYQIRIFNLNHLTLQLKWY